MNRKALATIIKRMLWGAAAAVLLTIAAEFWGFHRVELLNPWDASGNRSFLIASLLTLTALIHFWIQKSQLIELVAAEIERQGNSLAARNAHMEDRRHGPLEASTNAMVVATFEFPIKLTRSPLKSAEGIPAEKHLAQMEGRYRGLLEAAPDAMVVVNQGRANCPAECSGGETKFGYLLYEWVGQKK